MTADMTLTLAIAASLSPEYLSRRTKLATNASCQYCRHQTYITLLVFSNKLLLTYESSSISVLE